MAIALQDQVTSAAAKAWRQLRVDLAAAHRIAAMQGFNEGIFNHLTAYSPARPDRFLALPFGRYWTEAVASELIEVGFDGAVLDGAGHVESSSYCIHAPIHQARPDSACVLHTHMPYASALTRLEDPRLKAIGQTEITFMNDIAYDGDYAGFARSPEEGRRMAKVLGAKNILFLANHGVIVLGASIAEAYDRLYYLERACQVQLYAMWTGAPLKYVAPEVTRLLTGQNGAPQLYDGRTGAEHHFDALKRVVSGVVRKNFDD